MVLRDNDAAIPAITGKHAQVLKQLHSLRGDGKIHATVRRHLGDLHRCTLMHMQGDIRITIDEFPDYGRQHITGLSLGRCYRQTAPFVIVILLGNPADILDLTQDLPANIDNLLAGFGDLRKVFPTPGEGPLPKSIRVVELGGGPSGQ